MSVLDAPPIARHRDDPVDPAPSVTAARWALLIGPVLFMVGYALHPDIPSDLAGALAKAGEARRRLITAKILVTAGALLWVPLLVAIRRLAPEGRGARLVNLGAWMAVIGTTFNALAQTTFGYLLWSASAPGVDHASGRAVLAATDHQSLSTLPLSFFLSIPLFSLGLILLAIGLWRSGATPRWASACLVAGVVLAAATGIGPAVLPGGVALIAAALAFISALGTAHPAELDGV